MDVQRITPEQTYSLRHKILRPHQPYEACQYETDHNRTSFHLGVVEKGEIVSVASFYQESFSGLSSRKPYRLRAMATVETYRYRGAGRRIVAEGEQVIKSESGDLLWCKGRTTVLRYYEKLGFETFGEIFDYPPIGPHIILYKEL